VIGTPPERRPALPGPLAAAVPTVRPRPRATGRFAERLAARALDLTAQARFTPTLVLALIGLASVMVLPPGGSTTVGASRPATGASAARIAALAARPADPTTLTASGGADLVFVEFDPPGAAPPPVFEGRFAADGTMLKPFAVAEDLDGVADQMRQYIVRSGDTLTRIAQRFGLNMATLFWANKLTDRDTLRPGQVLHIPPTDGVLHTVEEGDTIESIVAAYHADLDAFVAYNDLHGDVVVIGETFMVPGGRGDPIPAPAPASNSRDSSTVSEPSPIGASRCTGWTDSSAPPSTIRVLRTFGSAAGTVQRVDFRSYVEMVMAAEWSVSLPAIALQAGAIAVKQYGWYYAMHYRGGRNASGVCFDVRDTTADQIYRPETRAPTAAHKAAVSATWSMSIRRERLGLPGQFILTGYRTGTIAVCGAERNGFVLYQAGVGDCADQGMTLEQIEGLYYGPTLQIHLTP
jgi:LysM repeat protein